MGQQFSVPEDYKSSFQRLAPYMSASIRNDQKALEAVLLYLKLGGEKLARIALDAFKQNQRLENAETKKKLREAVMLTEHIDQAEDEKDDDADDEESDDDDSDY